MVSYNPAKFGGHRHCVSRDIMVLVCHMILQDHITKGILNIMGRTPSRLVTILSSFVVISTLE